MQQFFTDNCENLWNITEESSLFIGISTCHWMLLVTFTDEFTLTLFPGFNTKGILLALKMEYGYQNYHHEC